jgi:predicted dithiol-disulfide oxidoreductase (DUF899 family)
VEGYPPSEQTNLLFWTGCLPSAATVTVRIGRTSGPFECSRHDARVCVEGDIEGLKKRHGWEHIPWYTIGDDFHKDFDVDQWHGTNAFIREDGRVFRTYFINNRDDEQMGGTWNYLDITALGRQEDWEDSPEGYPQTPPYQWWNYHDAYNAAK